MYVLIFFKASISTGLYMMSSCMMIAISKPNTRSIKCCICLLYKHKKYS